MYQLSECESGIKYYSQLLTNPTLETCSTRTGPDLPPGDPSDVDDDGLREVSCELECDFDNTPSLTVLNAPTNDFSKSSLETLSPDDPAIVWPEGENTVSVLGTPLPAPTGNEAKSLQSLLAVYPRGRTKNTILPNGEDAGRKALKTLAAKHELWEAAIVSKPMGKANGGYRVRSCRDAEAYRKAIAGSDPK